MKIIEKAMENDDILFAKLRGIDAAINRIEHETEKICWKYLSGESNMEETAKDASRPWDVHAVMHAKGWSFWPTYPRGTDYARHDRYEAMVKDYVLWEKDEPFSDEKWLFTWESDSSLGFAPYRMAECVEAKDYEKAQFFRACEAAITPISCFDSPSGIDIPSFWNPNTKGELHLELRADATPLLLADDPIIGKEFRLPIEGGGALCIKVVNVEPGWSLPFGDEDEEDDDDSFDSLEWECEGHIEGYTSTTPRHITFSTWDTEISFVTADVLEEEDWKAFRESELWTPFEQWAERRNARVDAEALDLFAAACERLSLIGQSDANDTEDIF